MPESPNPIISFGTVLASYTESQSMIREKVVFLIAPFRAIISSHHLWWWNLT